MKNHYDPGLMRGVIFMLSRVYWHHSIEGSLVMGYCQKLVTFELNECLQEFI